MSEEFVSILMLTYNAPEYVKISVDSVRAMTEGVKYELVVVDNASGPETVELVKALHAEGKIDRLVLSEKNTLFAGGNNIAARHASPDATHFLLLNSDIEAKRPDWLRRLLDNRPEKGVISYGMVAKPLRADGYCFLVDADLYRDEGGLDEGFQWWWGVTKFQARLMVKGHPVRGWYEHDRYLVHFGGKSGDAFKKAAGMGVPKSEVFGWFEGRKPEVFDIWAMRIDMLRRGVRRVLRKLGLAGK